jgi:acyl-CoA thioesterase
MPEAALRDEEIHERYFEQICEKLRQDALARFLGARLVEIGKGTATAELTVTSDMLNFLGSTHGGVVFALADTVFAAASNSYGKVAVALSMHIGYLAPSFEGAKLRATAVETRRTGRTSWYRITVESDNEVLAILDALAFRKNEYFIALE